MRKHALKIIIAGAICFVAGFCAIFIPACATSTTITPASTNSAGVITPASTNTVINQAALDFDASALQGGATLALSYIIPKDPGIVPDLRIAQTSLSAILNGATTNTVSQVLTLLGQSSNATLSTNIAPLVAQGNAYEQSLIAKYGAANAGKVTLALAGALNNALVATLPK
jgi:hypothetical protein